MDHFTWPDTVLFSVISISAAASFIALCYFMYRDGQ